MNVAIIPARGGSQRIPRKNVRLFHGKPIIAYSIEAARASGFFERIVVTTDDEEIAHVALKYDADFFMRPPDDGTRGTQEVAAEALAHSRGARFACCIYPCAPLMLPADLEAGFRKLGIRGNPYVYSVGHDGVDAGQWYWGTARAFLEGVPLEGNSWHYALPESRVCDINTEEDWMRAERLYAELQAGTA